MSSFRTMEIHSSVHKGIHTNQEINKEVDKMVETDPEGFQTNIYLVQLTCNRQEGSYHNGEISNLENVFE